MKLSKKNKPLFILNNNSEIIDENLQRNNRKLFKSDTPFDNSFIPYIIMFICATVDAITFYSLFSRISYDNPVALVIQIIGFLFGFDVVPIFLGIHYRRLKQGLTKDKIIVFLGLTVFCLVIATNIALRITTIDMMSPSSVSTPTSFISSTSKVSASNSGSDFAVAISLTIFGMIIPIVTSLGSFFISYMTYNPLNIKKKRLAEMITETEDEIRRYDAVIDDFDAESDFSERIIEEDKASYNVLLAIYKSKAFDYYNYTRERLKEHLADPATNSQLSQDKCQELMKILDKDIAAIKGQINTISNTSNDSVKIFHEASA